MLVRRSHDDRGGDGTTKSGKTRVVPLSDQAVVALDGLSRRELFTGPTDHVFAWTTGGRMPDEHGRDVLYMALEAAGIGHLRERAPGRQPFRFHDLRHTFGTICAAGGIDVVRIQEWMGHADLATTRRYMHYAPRADDAARLTEAFGGGASEARQPGVGSAHGAEASA